MHGSPRYTRTEFERRCLVDRATLSRLALRPYSKHIHDRYLACGCAPSTNPLAAASSSSPKRFAFNDPRAREMVTIRLDEAEHAAFFSLDGSPLTKRRHFLEAAGDWAIDVFEGALSGLVTCEIEADAMSELVALATPTFAEVTADRFFDGGNLCQLTADALRAGLRERGYDIHLG